MPDTAELLAHLVGRRLPVGLQDCTLMGYKVFGVEVEKNTVAEIGPGIPTR